MEKIVKYFLVSLVIFFLVMLFANMSGYYDSKEKKAKVLTEEQIKMFEQDISEGKSIDVRAYTKELKKDYTSDLSNNIYKASLKIEKVFDSGIKKIFKQAETMVSD